MSQTITADVVSEEKTEPKEPKVGPAIKSAAHTTGRVVADFNLRQVGRGFKRLGAKLPRVEIVRKES